MVLNGLQVKVCNIPSDKYVHVLACQVLAFFVGKVLSIVMNRYIAALIGCVVAIGIGFIKEIKDDTFNYDDFKADIIGSIWGSVYLIL
jgi:capsular polysaccharide biosynthesis protein